MNEEGFIKLYRKILSWEWTDDNNMLCFFIRLLFVVNYQDKQWHGITIKRGSFVTSMDKLCELMKMSKSAVKRCLENLRTTGEITEHIAENRYRIISVVNYDKYQSVGTFGGNENTNSRTNCRTNSRTPTKEIKKYSSYSYRNKKNTAKTKTAAEKLPEKTAAHKQAVSYWDFVELAEQCSLHDPFACNTFYNAFKASGTAMPENAAEIYERFLNADQEHRNEFTENLISGKYKKKWGECRYDL